MSQPRICDKLGMPALTSAGIYALYDSIRSADSRWPEASSVFEYCVAAMWSLSAVACTRPANIAAVDVAAAYAWPTAVEVAWCGGPVIPVGT